ncbi:CzcE family metal-binding protein [Aromatoleum toluvorans]|uniref:CzcE family metal-binding protein n=1 Tax=Aromatoleum toluvorans TaxID=92002 RepID=A0ABX1Q248_9RHOO|nr:CzcE family metal-binding protein [Aromatoleum toluvorans]NMG44589.1 CzcE family metal-binding protein [Aromatoleum toluvorans]
MTSRTGTLRRARTYRRPARIAVATLILAATAGASAHTDYSENGSTHWLEHVQASPNPASERQLAPYGHAAPAAAPGRVIVVGKDTRYLNVEQLETVAIRSGDQTVNWTFDTMPRRSFPLSKIIPGTDGVTVYVAESPLYSGR